MARGAWLAVGSTAALWLAWIVIGQWARRRAESPDRAWRVQLAATGGILLLALVLAAAGAALILAGQLPGTATVANRIQLLRNALLLAGDHAFTGAGLGSFPMQFSTYVLLIHVPHTFHSHNMLLNLLIDQGVLGLASYLLMAGAAVVFALRRLPSATPGRATIIEAGLASLAVALVNGQVNDPLYASRGALFLLLPFGVLMAAAGSHTFTREAARAWRTGRRRSWAIGLVVVAAITIAVLVRLKPALATAYANAGALVQARVELGAYDPQRWDDPSIDEIRAQEDLGPAIAHFQHALAFDPGNRTARQRLAGIALSQSQYDAALAHGEAATAAGHRDSVTRMLLADALVATGYVERAAGTIRGLEGTESRLLAQAWFRYWATGDYRRAADAWRTVLLLDPENVQATRWLAQAEERAGESVDG
jgi:hypothetical protein